MSHQEGLRTSTHRARRAAVVAALLLLGACSGGSRPVAPSTPSGPLLAAGEIGPAGGSLEVVDGPHAGVSLTVPAGAVAAPTRFTITLEQADPDLPSLLPVYRIDPDAIDFSLDPATVSVRYGAALAPSNGAAPPLTLFCRPDSASAWNTCVPSQVDAVASTVTAPARRLGRFVALDAYLHRMFAQSHRLLEPGAITRVEVINGIQVTTGNGSLSIQVGRGSLASFWQSPASANVLIVHGLFGSPLDFLGLGDFVAGLPPSVQNVVLLSYPSARGVAAAANELYDEIVALRGPSFGCSILGHSMGALVARYLLERSHVDPSRPGYDAADEPLDDAVAQLVMLGPPNAGTPLAGAALQGLYAALPPEERSFLQVVPDLGGQPDSVTSVLNGVYVDNATRYHIVYGDVGGGTDGVVSVASALALPLFPPETATPFPVNHDDLHRQAQQAGILAHVAALLGAP